MQDELTVLPQMKKFLNQWLFDPTMGKLIFTAAGIIIILIIFRFLQNYLITHVTNTGVRYRAKKIVSFIGYLVVFIFLATVFSDRLSKLTIAFGVAGAGIAFALQEVIASIAGWIAISFGQFYSSGDRIQMRGIKGDVIDVGVLSSTIMEVGQWVNGDLYNGRIVKLANSLLFKEPVFNYSADFPFLWDEITIPLKYGSDWKYARSVFQKVADNVCGEYAKQSKNAWKNVVKKYRIENAQVEPLISMRADENWVEYTLRYIVDFQLRRSTKDKLFTQILEEIDKSKGKIRIATSSMELSADPHIRVQLDKS